MGDTLQEKIKEIILPELRYLRTYTAQVIDNDIGDGKLKLSCPPLGWEDEFSYAEAYPRDLVGSRILPLVGDYVELSFRDGKVEFPRWGALESEIKANNKVNQYSGPADKVLYEDRETGDYVKYNSSEKKYYLNVTGDVNVNGQNIYLNGQSKSFVTHTELDTVLQAFIVKLNAALASAAGGVPPALITLDISSAATQTVKTGG